MRLPIGGCLEGGGAPLGLLGTPLQKGYPRQNEGLQALVAAQGLLVKEQPREKWSLDYSAAGNRAAMSAVCRARRCKAMVGPR